MDNQTKVIHAAAAILAVSGAALAISEKGSMKTAKGKLGAFLCTAGVALEGALITGVLGSLFGKKQAEEVHGPIPA